MITFLNNWVNMINSIIENIEYIENIENIENISLYLNNISFHKRMLFK